MHATRNPATGAKTVSQAADGLLYPLTDFYAELSMSPPPVRRIEQDQMPEPYRRLLVHERDMTPTLEAAHGGKLHLRVLRYAERDGLVRRLVALVLDDETPVEVGAIKIYLDRLPQAARDLVLKKHVPFGTILQSQGVVHRSRPAGYFQVEVDGLIGEALGADNGAKLYGRRNTLWTAEGEALAEVVEILPLIKELA
jgi:chorismate-pyruvate lyase